MAIEHKTYRINEDADDQRLDRFLRKREKGMPLSTIFKAIRVGAITVNGKKATESSRIHTGDEIVWRVPSAIQNISDSKNLPQQPLSSAHPYHHRSLPVLYEDDRIVAIDKPSGVASQGGGKHTSFNLIDWARNQRPHDHLHMVHRLDAETSGVLVLAKGEKHARSLSAMWRSGHIKKTYHALIWGSSIASTGTWIDPIARGLGKEAHRSYIHPSGRPGEMHWAIEERCPIASHITVDLQTGRHHQIRVQTAHHGFPIIGDPIYGDPKHDAETIFSNGERRLMLHASSISLQYSPKEIVSIEAPLPPLFDEVWARCVAIAKSRSEKNSDTDGSDRPASQ